MCSPSAPSQPTQTSTVSIPEYAKPTAERLIGKAEALTDAPYQAYGGQRLTPSTPEQQAARESVAGMQAPSQYGTATGLAGAAGLAGLGAGQFTPTTFTAPLTQAAQLERFQAAGPSGVQSGLGSFGFVQSVEKLSFVK